MGVYDAALDHFAQQYHLFEGIADQRKAQRIQLLPIITALFTEHPPGWASILPHTIPPIYKMLATIIDLKGFSCAKTEDFPKLFTSDFLSSFQACESLKVGYLPTSFLLIQVKSQCEQLTNNCDQPSNKLLTNLFSTN